MRGADVLVRSLVNAGVRHVFTLSGNHIMSVFDAALDAGLNLVHTRHEAAAVHMADAWARLMGEPGIALVTAGPGHANALSALHTAQMAESPVVLLSGHAAHDEQGRGAFQEMRQAEMAAPVTKASWTCANAADVAADLARAVRIARSGRPGPVHLSLPTEALESEVDSSATHDVAAFTPESITIANGDTVTLLAALRRAKRPLILAGPASCTRAGGRRLAALEAAAGIPCLGMESPRGINDPCLGAFADILVEADCILLLGKRLDFTLAFGRAPAIDANCVFLQIDPERFELDRTGRAVAGRLGARAVADVAAAIDALTVLARYSGPIHEAWQDKVRAAIAYRPAAWDRVHATERGKLHPVEACRPLQRLLDSHPDSVFVCDGGEFGQWAQACLSAQNRVINGAAGAIGSALPFALAARLAQPAAPVVVLMGDGTFGFHMAEIDTAVRCALPFVAVVGNDARWNAEYQIQLRRFGPGRLIGCELRPLRYDEVTQALGGHGEHVTDAGELLAAAERAQGSGLPAVLDVAIEGVAAPVVRRSG
ncbi:MAG: thiamine pyrophosphate-binding protein [Casimicrobiaceae bacterium]